MKSRIGETKSALRDGVGSKSKIFSRLMGHLKKDLSMFRQRGRALERRLAYWCE